MLKIHEPFHGAVLNHRHGVQDEKGQTIADLSASPRTAEVMDPFTHEQYFWPFYRNYLPDHADRLDVMLRWVTERGYEPVFFHENYPGA